MFGGNNYFAFCKDLKSRVLLMKPSLRNNNNNTFTKNFKRLYTVLGIHIRYCIVLERAVNENLTREADILV